MKRLISILALLPLLAAGPQQQMGHSHRYAVASSGGHALVVAQEVTLYMTGGGAGPTWTATVSATPSGASVIANCAMSAAFTGFTPASPTQIFSAGPHYTDGTWVWNNITAGTTQIKFTFASAYSVGVCIVAVVTGATTSSVVDVPGSIPVAAGSSTYSTSITTGSQTTTNANDAVIGMADINTTITYTAGASYTMIGAGCQGAYCAAMEFLNVSSTGAYNPPMTQSAAGYSDVGTVALKLL